MTPVPAIPDRPALAKALGTARGACQWCTRTGCRTPDDCDRLHAYFTANPPPSPAAP